MTNSSQISGKATGGTEKNRMTNGMTSNRMTNNIAKMGLFYK